MKNLIMVGNDSSHLVALRLLRKHPFREASVTLVSDQENIFYPSMIPGLIAGHYSEDECRIDLPSLCTAAGVNFLHAAVDSIDLSLAQIRQDVGTIHFRHDLAPYFASPEPLAGELGIDSIALVVPEPATALFLLAPFLLRARRCEQIR